MQDLQDRNELLSATLEEAQVLNAPTSAHSLQKALFYSPQEEIRVMKELTAIEYVICVL